MKLFKILVCLLIATSLLLSGCAEQDQEESMETEEMVTEEMGTEEEEVVAQV